MKTTLSNSSSPASTTAAIGAAGATTREEMLRDVFNNVASQLAAAL
jgi:hypothetical protein